MSVRVSIPETDENVPLPSQYLNVGSGVHRVSTETWRQVCDVYRRSNEIELVWNSQYV